MNTLAADFTELAKEYTLPNQKISIWDQFLTGQSQYYEGLAQQTQDVASYDISEAYSNYKKQQLQLQMNEQLGSGFKQQLGSELQSAYGKTYQDIRTQEESALASITSKYAEARLESEEQIAEYGQYAKDISNIFDQFAQNEMGIKFEDIDVNGQTVDSLITPVEQGGLGWYTQSKDEFGNITYDLTDYGREHYQNLLFSPTYAKKFEKYFEEENPELFEEFKKNQDFYQQIIGGLEYGQRAYDKELKKSLDEEQYKIAAENVKSKLNETRRQIIKEEYLDNASYTTEELRKMNEAFARNDKIISTGDASKAKKQSGSIFTSHPYIFDDYGRLWNVSRSSNDKNIDSVGLRGVQKGDIVYVDGRYAIITGFRGNKYVQYTYLEKFELKDASGRVS